MSVSTDHVPDDVWLEIFSWLPPPDVVTLHSVSTYFRALAERPLMFNIFWTNYRYIKSDLYSWSRGNKSALTQLPRTATISIPSLSRRVYAAMNHQLTLFPSLHTLTLAGTSFNKDIYIVLTLPALQTLIIVDCTFEPGSTANPIDFRGLPLRRLTLHNLRVPKDCCSNIHPIGLLAGTSLSSVGITWTDNVMHAYKDIFMGNQAQGQPNPAALGNLAQTIQPAPNLRFLQLHIPLLRRDLLHGLAHFTGQRGAHGFPPRVDLAVRYWSLTREEVSNLDRARQIQMGQLTQSPVQGIWSYTGPPEILGIFVPLSTKPATSSAMLSTMRTGGDGDALDADDLDGNDFVLRNLRFLSPAMKPHKLARLLWTVGTDAHPVSGERIRKAKNIFQLDVCLTRWDIEILLAIRAICGGIRKIVIRVREEVDGEEICNMLGDIVSDLPHLRSLQIIHDPQCYATDTADGRTEQSGYMAHPDLYNLPVRMFSPAGIVDKLCVPSREDLVGDYVYGWGRLCSSLREVQVGDGIEWFRGWEGGKWEGRKVERRGEIYLHAMDALKGWFSDY